MLITLGALWLVATCVLSAHGVEPVASFSFLFAWAGLIFTFDRLIARAEGRSLVGRLGPAAFVLLMAWSAVNWFAYELANVRLGNWHYVLVTDVWALRFLATVLAFGTVFPGVFWIDHWLNARGVFTDELRRARGSIPADRLPEALLWGLQLAGAAALALALADPRHFFPLIWGVTALVVAPVNHRLGIGGWLAQWSRRQWGPTLRMLLAGLIAGGCWEFFNVWARARWIYTVPFFDELKLFEMPLLGFVGFPPFALECACVYRLLVWYRLAPAFGTFSQVGPCRGAATRWLAVALGTGIAAAGWVAVDHVIATSRTPRVADVVGLDPAQRQALADAGVTHLTQLVGWGSDPQWKRVRVTLDEASPDGEAAERLRDRVDLYLHQGIGTTYGNQLVAAGIESLDDLRGLSVDEVWQRLKAGPGPVPSRAQIKVWLRRLPAPRQAER